MREYDSIAEFVDTLALLKRQEKKIVNFEMLTLAVPLLNQLMQLVPQSIISVDSKLQAHFQNALLHERGTDERNAFLDQAEGLQKILAFYTGFVSEGLPKTTLVLKLELIKLITMAKTFNQDMMDLQKHI